MGDAYSFGSGANVTKFDNDGVQTMEANARRYKTLTLNPNHASVAAHGKPTTVTLGAHSAFSLPVYAADNEELRACKSLPTDIDVTENMTLFIGCYIDTANTSKKFKLQVSWTVDDLSAEGTPLTSGVADVEVETTTGTAAQYAPYKVPFTIASVAAGAAVGNKFGVRLRRIAASGDEIAGEVAVCGFALRYVMNQLGTAI